MPASSLLPNAVRRAADRLAWELREWKKPSRPAFIQDELDEAILRHVRWTPGERVLDIGCATGMYMKRLAEKGCRVFGVDVGSAMLQRAVSQGHRVVGGDAISLPFAAGSFDTIFCHRTLYLLDQPAQAIQEFHRVLKPAGRIAFSTSNASSPYARVQAGQLREPRHSNWRIGNRWSATEWCRALNEHGFGVSAIYSCNLVWPIVFRVCDRWIVPNE
jgi:SAM-dependent methyltransferase